MLFPTIEFALFFLVIYPISWALNSNIERRKFFLLAISYFFYAYWDYRFLSLVFLSSILNHHAGWLLAINKDRRLRKKILWIAVLANLLILGFFKYYGFFLESLSVILQHYNIERDLPFLEIILPIGISFFTFQGISYVVDIYRGDIKKNASFLDVLLYISFFPQLVAGPIVRASYFLPQLRKKPELTRTLMSIGILYILIGLFKKMVIANYLATYVVDKVFFDPTAYGSFDLLLAAYAYAVQIYCDFSGYSDIAIGIAALLGYRFQRNFKQPYRASSLRDFWQRWHISLSQWLRDYLYKPLGGSWGGKLKTYRNLFLTMLIGGIWHGAAWTFVIWGALHGFILMLEHLWSSFREKAGRKKGKRASVRKKSILMHALAVFVTFHIICLTWIFFRAGSLEIALSYIEGFTRFSQAPVFVTPFLSGLIFFSIMSHFLRPDLMLRMAAKLRNYSVTRTGVVTAFSIIFIWAVAPDGIAPFIYFQF